MILCLDETEGQSQDVGNDIAMESKSAENPDQDGVEGVADGEPDDDVDENETLNKLKKGANRARRGVQLAQAGTGMVEDGARMKQGFDQKEADDAQAAADAALAQIQRQAQFMKQDDELIKSLIQKLETVFSTCAQEISTQHQGEKALAQGIAIPQTTA